MYLVIMWSLRFAYEFLKENQVSFENNMPLNMGQLLSIPLLLTGLVVMYFTFIKNKAEISVYDSLYNKQYF